MQNTWNRRGGFHESSTPPTLSEQVRQWLDSLHVSEDLDWMYNSEDEEVEESFPRGHAEFIHI